jgi:hypothetical protein
MPHVTVLWQRKTKHLFCRACVSLVFFVSGLPFVFKGIKIKANALYNHICPTQKTPFFRTCVLIDFHCVALAFCRKKVNGKTKRPMEPFSGRKRNQVPCVGPVFK